MNHPPSFRSWTARSACWGLCGVWSSEPRAELWKAERQAARRVLEAFGGRSAVHCIHTCSEATWPNATPRAECEQRASFASLPVLSETSVPSDCASVSHPATLISTGRGLARGGFSPMHARQTLAGVVLAPATAPKPRPDRPRSEVSDSDGFINCCVATRSNNTTAGQEAWKAWR